MEDYRNWLELPSNVALTILMKIPQRDVLQSVQFVCKPWYNLCKDPSRWRSIKFKYLKRSSMAATIAESQVFGIRKELMQLAPNKPKVVFDQDKMVLHAVDRSAGGLVDLDVEEFILADLISYVASSPSIQLKRLCLVRCDLWFADLIEALGKLTSLDELELTLCRVLDVISVIESCTSLLTTLKLNQSGSRSSLGASDDNVALVIAKHLPQLRHLQLRGNGMTNVGLSAILDGCPHLQSLDVRECFHLDVEGDLGKRLSEQFIDLQLPDDSTKDCNYYTSDYHYELDYLTNLVTDMDIGLFGYDYPCDYDNFDEGCFC